MALMTIQEIFDDLGSLRDTTSGALTTSEKYAAINNTLRTFRTLADWKFNIRKKTFDYLPDEPSYSVSGNLSLTDWKAPRELRVAYDEGVNFTYENPDHFSLLWGGGTQGNYYTVDDQDGSKILRIQRNSDTSSTVVHALSAYDTNGTWAAVSGTDAASVATDAQEFRQGSGSVKFNVTVATSAANQAAVQVTDMIAVDLSAYLDRGHLRLWVWIPTITYLDSSDTFRLRWGSSSAAYWDVTTAANAIGGSFEVGWNRLDFDWSTATKTGSPDEAAIDFLYLEVNYSASQTNMTAMRINELKIFEPEKMELRYYSNFYVQTTSSVYQENASATTDKITLPTDLYACFRAKLLNLLSIRLYGAASDDALLWDREFKALLPQAVAAYGVAVRQPIRRMKPWTGKWTRHGLRTFSSTNHE